MKEEKPLQPQTVSEVKCVSCKYGKLQAFALGDYVGKTLPDACPKCKNDLVITGIYEFLGDVTKAPEFTVLEQLEQFVDAEFVISARKLNESAVILKVKSRYDVEQSFERLKPKFSDLGYLPIIAEENGQLIVAAVPKLRIEPKTRGPWINLILLLATLGTTFVAGYLQSEAWIKFTKASTASLFENAILFALAIMTIIGVHELGHTLMARKHGVKATLPFFVPAPPVPFPVGTFGAVISMRSPIPSRKALFDIGAAGPVAGLLVTLPILIIGLKWSAIVSGPVEHGLPVPILMGLLVPFLVGPVDPSNQAIYLHPLGFAGWVGLIVLMFNLMPVGQLDGGHVSRAIFKPSTHKLISFIAIAVTIFIGWIVMALLMFWLSFYEHPRPLNDVSKLDKGRNIFAVILFLVLALSINPPPTLSI